MCEVSCVHAVRRSIPVTASAESLAIFKKYQAMFETVSGNADHATNPLENFFDECRATGRAKRLSVIHSKHYEPLKAIDTHKNEEVLICTLPTNSRCKGYVSSQR